MSRESVGATRSSYEVGFDPQPNCEQRAQLQFGEDDQLLSQLFDPESAEECETVSFESVTSD
jgi:hypothetical protein